MDARLRRFLAATVGLLPVRIRSGAAAGARWTLFPWSSYWRGGHEPEMQALFLSLGGGNIRGWSCWDLGAHYGLYSVALGLGVGPEGQVAAFEPNPASFARLERHRRMNGLTWMKVYPEAVSDASGASELLTYGNLDTTETHLAYDEGEAHAHPAGAIPIRSVRLDELVEKGELRGPRFVKVDVEGHAHRALAGMRTTLATFRPLLVVAFHSEHEVAGVLALLSPLGYRSTPVGTPIRSDSMIGSDYLFTP